MQSTDLFCLDFWLEPGAQGGGGDAYDRSGGGGDAGMPGNWHCIWKTFHTGFVDMFLCCFGVNQKEIWWIFKQLRKEEFRENTLVWSINVVFFPEILCESK